MKQRSTLLVVVLVALLAACAPSSSPSVSRELWQGELVFNDGETKSIILIINARGPIEGTGHLDDGNVYFIYPREGSLRTASPASWRMTPDRTLNEAYVFMGEFTNNTRFEGNFLHIRFGKERYGKAIITLTPPPGRKQ